MDYLPGNIDSTKDVIGEFTLNEPSSLSKDITLMPSQVAGSGRKFMA